MNRLFGMLLATLLLPACTSLTGVNRGAGTIGENWVRTTLENGLRVVIVEDHSAPVVALNVWVRAGGADETVAEAGMAHVFEHMLFKGTERRAVGEIARTVEAAGGDINAFTAFDMTVYHITMASRDAAVGIDVLADAVLHSTFDPEELAREKEVILEEIRRGEDSPPRVLSQRLFSTAYTRHPYREPVIGSAETVAGFTRDQLLDFHRRWYVPGNMTFVAVGDLDPEAALGHIREAFREVEPSPQPLHRRESEPEQEAPRASIVRRDFNQPSLGIAFPIVEFAHADTPYLDLLGVIVGGGESSRLYRNVKDKQRLVHTIGASSYTPLDPGLFAIDASLEGERIEEALSATAREIQHLRSFGPSEPEIERARVNLLASEVHEKETMQGQARKLGYYEALAGGIEKEAEYLDRIRRATVEDVQRVARTYLVPERLTVVALLPNAARPDLEAAGLIRAYQAGLRHPEEVVGEPLQEGIWRYRLPNGLRLVVKRNPTVPLVALRLSFLGGLLAETEETQGISAFLANVVERGTESRSAAQIAAEVEGIAGSLDGFSGRNSFGITAQFLTESMDTGLELFSDVLLNASFPEEEIEKVRVETLAALDRREDNLAGKAFELFSKTVYGEHPYHLPTLGDRESVARFDREALVRYYRHYAVPQNGVLAIVGDVDPEALVEVIESHLADWREPEEEVELPTRPLPPVSDRPRREEIEKNKQQSHIVFGFLGFSLADPDRPTAEVLTQILSGQGGRLFLELRDRQSLAYSVSAFSLEGLDPGSFGVYIACAPEKVGDALEGIRSELRRVLEDPIPEAELERARRYLVGSQAVSLQRYGVQASLLSLDELYGLGATHHLDYASRVEAVSIEDVRRVAKRLIHLEAPVIAIIR